MALPVKTPPCHAQEDENRRWQATVTFIDESWSFIHFDDFDELARRINDGADLRLIKEINIELNSDSAESIGKFRERELP
jgi:hypothetical protein